MTLTFNKNKVFKLQGKVQHYAWGGVSFLPGLLKIPNPHQEPFAEYWMGAHDKSPSMVEMNSAGNINLNEYIKQFPEQTLGAPVAAQFGRLPYLLKLLDVKDMLSIQVHPAKKNAEQAFAEENRKGIPPDAPHRNYRDDNHKPELLAAIGEFWLLHGFKPAAALRAALERTPELRFLLPVFDKGYAHLYRTVMQMEQQEVDRILQPLLQRVLPDYSEGRLSRQQEDFWAARAALTHGDKGADRGIFSIYLFNLVQLQPGEALFQDTGLPHAYLEGQNVEIMANSDNVLRGGLTAKHIDVEELMKHVVFEPTIPAVIRQHQIAPHIGAYPTPAKDFELDKIELEEKESVEVHGHSTSIFIALKGEGWIRETGGHELGFRPGEAWVCFDKGRFTLQAREKTAVYFATVPQ